MNRKLHNSLVAIAASAALLVVGLLAATPIPPALPAAGVMVAVADQADADDARQADTSDAEDASEQRVIGKTRHRGQSMRMPFFSFAPRG